MGGYSKPIVVSLAVGTAYHSLLAYTLHKFLSQVDVVLRGRQTNDEQTFVKFDKALATGGVAGGVATGKTPPPHTGILLPSHAGGFGAHCFVHLYGSGFFFLSNACWVGKGPVAENGAGGAAANVPLSYVQGPNGFCKTRLDLLR